MKFLIFSDSHGYTANMRRVIDRQITPPDGIIFLGDIYPDIEKLETEYPDIPIYAVSGNCDMAAKYQTPELSEKLLTLDGVKVLFTHGHRYSVKFTMCELEGYARRRDADVVLFGHTHERYERYIPGGKKPLYMFNPGSVSNPRDGVASFGVLTIQNGQVLLSHGNVHI